MPACSRAPRPLRFCAEHPDAVDLRVRRDRADDRRTGRAVADQVLVRALDLDVPELRGRVEDERDPALHAAHARMVAVHAAVDDRHPHARAGAPLEGPLGGPPRSGASTTDWRLPRSNAPAQAGVLVTWRGPFPTARTARSTSRPSSPRPASSGEAGCASRALVTSIAIWLASVPSTCRVQSLASSTDASSTDVTPMTSPSGVINGAAQDRGRHVVGGLRDVPGEPGVALHVSHRDGLAGHRGPAADAAPDRDGDADDLRGTGPVGHDVGQRVAVLVHQRDRAGGGREEQRALPARTDPARPRVSPRLPRFPHESTVRSPSGRPSGTRYPPCQPLGARSGVCV